MDGADVARDTAELLPRVAPLLDDGEQVDVILRASDRPAKAVKVVAAGVWPFFKEHDRFLLVATDRRWLSLESAREDFAGALTVRGSFDREIRVETSWLRRFDGFDQPYAIDPVYELWAVAANDASDARRAGSSWSLAAAVPHLTAERDDDTTEALGATVMKLGRFVPRRRSR